MTARIRIAASPHWVRSIHRKVGGQAVEVIKVWRKEGGQARLVYERTTDVIVTVQWPSSVTYGDKPTITGTALDTKGLGVQSGTAYVEVSDDNGATWTRVGSGSAISNGAFSITPTLNVSGNVRLRVWVDVNPPLLDSASAEKSYSANLAQAGRPSAGSMSHTSVTLSWGAVPGASGYEVGNNGSPISGGTVTGTSLKVTTREATQYNFQVRAFVTLPGGSKVYGAWSPIRYFNGGRPEKRDTGSKTVRVQCANSKSHRNDSIGWGSSPNYVRQGYFSSPYGGQGYIGVYDYGGTSAVKNAIISAVGQTRYDKGSASSGYTKVYRRGDVGNRVTATIRFRVSKQGVGGARPSLAGTEVTKAMNYNSWNTVNLNSSLLNGLTKNGYRSLCIYVNNSADYAALNRHTAGAEDGDLWVNWSWNYVSQSYIAPRSWT